MGGTDERSNLGSQQSDERGLQIKRITSKHWLDTVINVVRVGSCTLTSESALRYAAHTDILKATDNAGTYNCFTALAEQHWDRG
jgi:hypothetical protein